MVIALATAIVACSNGGDDPTVPPNPTSTPRPSTATAEPTSTETTVPSTPTPSPTATPSPTPSPTPTPVAPNVAYFAIFDLAESLGVSQNTISITSYDQETWPNSAYGCPAPGMFYAEGQVSGWNVTLLAGGDSYEYHTDINGELAVNCTKNLDEIANSVNVVELADLRSTTEIEMRRRDATGDFVLKATVTEQSEIDAIVDTLDVLVHPSPEASCTEVFRVVFKTSSGEQVIGTICGGNSRLIRGDQAFWEGQDANAPREFSDIIGPYFSNDPNPGVPE